MHSLHPLAFVAAAAPEVPAGMWGPVVAVPVWPAVAALLVLAITTWAGVRRATRALRQEKDDAWRRVDALHTELVDTDRRRRELFERVEGILGERDDWQVLYRQQAAAHGVAQELLLGERAHLLKQIFAVGKKPRTNNAIDRVVAAFEREHGAAAVAAQIAAAEAQRPAEPGGGSPAEQSDGAAEPKP